MLDRQPRQQRVLDGPQQVLPVESDERTGEPEIEGRAEDGSAPQQRLALAREPRHAQLDRVADTVRHSGPAASVEPAVEEMFRELLDVQRVAVRCGGHRVEELDGDLGTGDGRHQLLEICSIEPDQLDPGDRAVTPEFGERRTGGRGDVGGANRADDHQLRQLGPTRHERQEVERAGIGPVKIVEQQQRRPDRCEERRDRLEQLATLDGGVGPTGHQHLAVHVDQPRNESPQIAEVRRDGTVEANQCAADGLDERLEHAELLRGGSTAENRHLSDRELGGEFVGERALADTGLAGHEHDPRPIRPCVAKDASLVETADERASRSGCGGGVGRCTTACR